MEKDLDALRELTKFCFKKKFGVAKRLRRFQRASQAVLQKEISCSKKTYRELTKLCWKKKVAVGKKLRRFKKAYQLVLQNKNLLLQKD